MLTGILSSPSFGNVKEFFVQTLSILGNAFQTLLPPQFSRIKVYSLVEFAQIKSKLCDALIVLKETNVGSQIVVGTSTSLSQ